MLGVLGFVACSSKDDSGGGGTNADAAQDPQVLFRALQSDLVKACGGTNGECHVNGSYMAAPRWLGQPDPYLSAKNYRGIIPITHEPDDSIVLSQVHHEGPALKEITAAPGQRTLFDRVAEWITAEAPPPPLPNTGAFYVRSGFNLVHLDNIDPKLVGATITFLATDMNQVLTLSALKLTAPATANVHVTSPFFVILPRSGKVNADPMVNGFQGELTVSAGDTKDLFAGKMILLRWDSNGQLKIVFQAIDTTPGQAANSACTALDKFTGNAIPAMQMQVQVIDPDEGDGGVGGGDGGTVLGAGSCVGCHADTDPSPKYPAAVNAMDLRNYDTDPGTACANARRWIDFMNPTGSTILLNPQGMVNPAHPMKPISASDPIITGIATWVTAEKP
ncbi:MAG TPA: hypothetical protein VIF62_16825 [Labilithrix sp.]